MHSLALEYLDTRIDVRVAEATAAAMEPVLGFLGTHFRVEPGATAEPVDARVSVEPYAGLRVHEHTTSPGRYTLMKQASRKRYVVDGLRHPTRDGGTIVVTERTGTAYLWNGRDPHLRVFVTPNSWVHVIEFFRALVWTLQVAKGSTVLHAAAIEIDGRAVAIAGAKGAGKTTTLLHALSRPDVNYVSGDKLFVSMSGGRPHATGWPDFPNLGWGTIRAIPRLFEGITGELGHDPRHDTKKVVLPHEWFRRTVGYSINPATLPLAAIILPDIDITRPAPGRIRPTRPARTELDSIAEPRKRPSRSEGWEPFIEAAITWRPVTGCGTGPLADLAAFERTGTGELDDSLDLVRRSWRGRVPTP